MAMTGFGEEFRDPRDYILRVTETIWEGRGVHTLHRFYADDVVVRSPAGVVVGNQSVIAATQATLAEFPDRQLLGEDVIWSDDPRRRVPVVASDPVHRHPSGRRNLRHSHRHPADVPDHCGLRGPE